MAEYAPPPVDASPLAALTEPTFAGALTALQAHMFLPDARSLSFADLEDIFPEDDQPPLEEGTEIGQRRRFAVTTGTIGDERAGLLDLMSFHEDSIPLISPFFQEADSCQAPSNVVARTGFRYEFPRGLFNGQVLFTASHQLDVHAESRVSHEAGTYAREVLEGFAKAVGLAAVWLDYVRKYHGQRVEYRFKADERMGRDFATALTELQQK